MLIKFDDPVPVTPGEYLREHILAGAGITQDALAAAMGVSRFSVNQIVNGRRAVTAEMALRLAKVLTTSPDVWLNLQKDVDLWRARRGMGSELEALTVLRTVPEGGPTFVALDQLVGS